jgi:hypothetical protein
MVCLISGQSLNLTYIEFLKARGYSRITTGVDKQEVRNGGAPMERLASLSSLISGRLEGSLGLHFVGDI